MLASPTMRGASLLPATLSLAVVTPSFNGGRFIGETIRSVLEQDWPAINYVVMDAGSSDQTFDVVRSFGSRITWSSEPDRGQSDAINKGFAKTSGEVLAWLNTDDTWAPGAVRTAMQFLAEHPEVDLVYGDANFIDAKGRLISRCAHVEPFSRRRLFRYSDFIVQPAAFFRRSAFEAAGGLDIGLNWAMDYDLWLKIAQRGRVAYLPKVLANYRWLGESKTASGGWKRLDELTGLLRRYGYGPPAYVRLERVNAHLRDAMQSLSRRQLTTAVKSATRAAGTLLASRRAMGSLFSPHTWRIIYTGQVLRARSVAVEY